MVDMTVVPGTRYETQLRGSVAYLNNLLAPQLSSLNGKIDKILVSFSDGPLPAPEAVNAVREIVAKIQLDPGQVAVISQFALRDNFWTFVGTRTATVEELVGHALGHVLARPRPAGTMGEAWFGGGEEEAYPTQNIVADSLNLRQVTAGRDLIKYKVAGTCDLDDPQGGLRFASYAIVETG